MKKYDISTPVALKKGVYNLNGEANLNYQLIRVINWDGGRLEDIEKIGGKIKDSADWKRELIALGDEAMAGDRVENAIAYYRMSEFFYVRWRSRQKNITTKPRLFFMNIMRIISRDKIHASQNLKYHTRV